MIPQREIDDLLPEVTVHAPKAPEPLVLRYVREAARELCRRTRAWREEDTFDVVAPDCEAMVTIPAADIIEIENATLADIALEPVSPEWLDRNVRDWASLEGSPARYITQLLPTTVTVVPRAAGVLKARYVLEPSRDAFTVPSFLVDRYGTDIGKGAAARVLLVAGQEWSNPQLGAALLAEFKSLLDDLAHRAARGQHGASLRTRGAYF